MLPFSALALSFAVGSVVGATVTPLYLWPAPSPPSGSAKVTLTASVTADHVAWLGRMTDKWGLPDTDKALRVALEHAMLCASEDDVFGVTRCRSK